MTTLCTFNANNLFVRYRFGQTFPGDMSGKSAVTEPSLGYLPMYDPDMFDLFNPLQRDLTAKALKRGGTKLPEVLCLQEIESLIALRASQGTKARSRASPSAPFHAKHKRLRTWGRES